MNITMVSTCQAPGGPAPCCSLSPGDATPYQPARKVPAAKPAAYLSRALRCHAAPAAYLCGTAPSPGGERRPSGCRRKSSSEPHASISSRKLSASLSYPYSRSERHFRVATTEWPREKKLADHISNPNFKLIPLARFLTFK